MQLDPIKPTLKAPGPNLLTLKCDEPLSTFAFKFNLRRYNQSLIRDDTNWFYIVVGRCRLTRSNPS